MSRSRQLADAFEIVVDQMNLRAPQAEALRAFQEALSRLPKKLCECTPEQRREFLSFKSEWKHSYHPIFSISLATGVGKTRLAGAIIAFLWLSGEAQTFVILAPRRAVLRRFESALDPRFREYLFVNPQLVPEPSVVRADEIDSPTAVDFQADMLATGPKIYLLSPQLVTTSDRFKGSSEFTDTSAAEALRKRGDLVVLFDEAHHIGELTKATTTAWSGAIRALEPAMQVGLSATLRGTEGENVLYDYTLQQALAEARYTKAVQVLVRSFSDASTPEDIDAATIDFAKQRLEKKTQQALEAVAKGLPFPAVKPIAVLFARDIAHAQHVRDWIVATKRFEPAEVLLTHSQMAKSEDEIEKLLSIESPDNPVRVVINVMELMEGWDVTNVYVLAPLRALATFTGALQAMGRGLRLPAGHRIGIPELDTLDVICFGKESMEKIVREATDWEGKTSSGRKLVSVRSHTDSGVTRIAVWNPVVRKQELLVRDLGIKHEDISLDLPPEALSRIREAIVAGMELAAVKTRIGRSQEHARLPKDRFLQAASMRVIKALPEYLSEERDYKDVLAIVERWLVSLKRDVEMVEFDPAEVGDEIARQLRGGAERQIATYADCGKNLVIQFPEYEVFLEIALKEGKSAPKASLSMLPSITEEVPARDVPYRGWQRNLHEACVFDSKHEALVALMLDQASEVSIWVRNQPRRLVIPTPAGNHYPDFVVWTRNEKTGAEETLLLEVKGDIYWSPPDSSSRLKSRAAAIWATEQAKYGHAIVYRVALEQDVEASSSWADLCRRIIDPNSGGVQAA